MQLPETLEGWLGLLEARHGQAIQLGLDRVRAVRDALDLPQTCPVFTIGGTNGKGSTCALLEAVLLAAGLDGIDKQMQLGEPTSDDVWELTDGERQAMGIQPLPRSLDEALKIMEKSDFVASVLGEHAFEYFLRNKRQEWEEYRKQVTPFELKKYLPRL